MKRIKFANTMYILIVCTLVAIAIVYYLFRPEYKLYGEVIKVTPNTLVEHKWESVNLRISCVDSLQESHGYYWFIYDNPDQFESKLCVSTNRETYYMLEKYVKAYRRGNVWDDSRLVLYYGNREETVALYME